MASESTTGGASSRGVEGTSKRGRRQARVAGEARDLIVGRRVGQGKALRRSRKTAALRMPGRFQRLEEAGAGVGHGAAAGGQALRTLGCERLRWGCAEQRRVSPECVTLTAVPGGCEDGRSGNAGAESSVLPDQLCPRPWPSVAAEMG